MNAGARAYEGPPVLSCGFRPFFLLAGIWSSLAIPFWIAAWFGLQPFAGWLTRDWHVHEMLFGYLAAVVAGFLLTAVPNWTGRLPVRGGGLLALVGLWIAGRLAMLLPASAWTAMVDSAFLIVLTAVIAREVIVGRNWRNLPVCGLAGLLVLANVGMHLGARISGAAGLSERLALAAVAMMILLVGGRIVPSFTHNWLAQRGSPHRPASISRFDHAALVLSGAALALWVAVPLPSFTGWLLVAAGAASLLRLARWRGWQTMREPLVWILHVGYGWTALALICLGASALRPATVPLSAGIHALTAGGVGVMTLAVMTRAIRGHTGRAREADPGTLLIYMLINLSAASRIAAAAIPGGSAMLLGVAAAAWGLAFILFVAIYGPMCLSGRKDRE